MSDSQVNQIIYKSPTTDYIDQTKRNKEKCSENDDDDNNNDLIEKKTSADDNLSIYYLMEFPRRKNKELLKLIKDFLSKFTKFYSIRALFSLLKKVLKLKFKLNKLSLKDLLNITFNIDNLRTGLFLSIMPFVFSLLTEIVFEVNNNNNFTNNDNNFRNKIIVFLSGFISALIGISFSEKGIKIMNYIILSILVRSIHSLIVVILKNKGKKSESKFWAFLTFYIACFGFFFVAYYHPGYKPILKLYSNYLNYDVNEKEEVLSSLAKMNILKNIN